MVDLYESPFENGRLPVSNSGRIPICPLKLEPMKELTKTSRILSILG